jgi:hypothetical protein
LATVIVSAEVPGAETVLGLKLAVTFEGRPETLNTTEPLPVTLTTTEPLAPRLTVSGEGTEMVKLGAWVNVSDTVVEWTPPFPLIVTV